MEGPKDVIDVRAPVNPVVRKFECSPQTAKNGLPGCGPATCANIGMFDDNERRFTEVFYLVRSIRTWLLPIIINSLQR